MGGQGGPPWGPPWTLALMGGPAPPPRQASPGRRGGRPVTEGGPACQGGGARGGRPFSEAISKKKEEKKVDEVLKYHFPQKFGVITMIFIGIVGGPGLPRRGGLQGGPLKNSKRQGPHWKKVKCPMPPYVGNPVIWTKNIR